MVQRHSTSRIVGAGAKIVITADMAVRRGKSIPLKHVIEEAIINAPIVEHLIVLRRELGQPGRDPQRDGDRFLRV